VASSPLIETRPKKHRFRAFMAQPTKHPKTGIYQLRRKVPDELREALARREYKRSLDTRDPNEAKARFAAAWVESDRVFALARAQLTGEATYSRADAQQLAGRWFKAEQERMDEGGDFTAALASVSTVAVEQGDFREEHASYDTLRTVADADPELLNWRETVHKRLQAAMRVEGQPIPPKDSTAYRALFNAFEEHLDKLSAWALDRHYGESAARGVGVAAWAPIEAERRAKAAAKPKVNTLRDLFAEYSSEKTLNAGGKVKRDGSKTLKTYEAVVDDFIDLHGNLDVRSINRHLIAQHRGQVARLPAKGKGIRGLTALQLVEKADTEGLPCLTPQTVRNRLRALSAVFGVGVRLGWMNENPVIAGGAARAAAMAAAKQQAGKASRKHYTGEELRAIFASPVFASAGWQPPRADFGKAWFWLPLLLYYTGARREELAQLAVADVRLDEAAGWYLSILEQDDQDGELTVKTAGSRRRIPLHPDLIARGFIDYVQGLPRSGRLFPKLQPDAKGYYGANFGRRWTEYLRRTAKVASTANPSHGFRHTFKTLCREVGVPEDVHDAITGHSGGASVARGYGTMPLSRMAQEIRRYPPAPMQSPEGSGR
jgi:integrase